MQRPRGRREPWPALRHVAVLAMFRILLAVLGYRRIRNWAVLAPRQVDERGDSFHYARQLTRSVHRASRYVPGAACLARALTVQFLLARSGHRAQILVGVAPTAVPGTAALRAHAWIECNGRAIDVIDPTSDFTPLLWIGARQ